MNRKTNLYNLIEEYTFECENENIILINHSFNLMKYYKTYQLIKYNGKYDIQEMNDKTHFSFAVKTFLLKEPTELILNYIIENENKKVKEPNAYCEITFSDYFMRKEMKKHNIVDKEFVVKENNYRICIKDGSLYVVNDLEVEVVCSIYFKTIEEANLIINEVKQNIEIY